MFLIRERTRKGLEGLGVLVMKCMSLGENKQERLALRPEVLAAELN